MREFFFNLLNELDKLTGIRQMDKLQSLPDDESRKEINALLDILCQTCQLFPLIPKDAQKSIIRQAVISDGDFIGLNAKFIYKSLQAHKDKYFREAAHIPSEQDPNWKPVEGQQRDEWLNKWAQSLEGFAEKVETKSHVKILEESLPPKDKGIVYHSTRLEQIFNKELHLQYVRENYDPVTKDKLSTWLPEEEWISKQLEK